MLSPTSPTPIAHPHVEQLPDVQGGVPVIRGTRFPVSSIVRNHRRGLSVDEILREFPSLTPAAVYDALSFYYDHRAEIDAEMAESDRIGEMMRNFPPALIPPVHGR